MTNKTKSVLHLHHHHHHWGVQHGSISFDTKRALIVCSSVGVVGIILLTYIYVRNRPGMLSKVLTNIVQYIISLYDASRTIAAREERAVNAVVSDPIPAGKFLSIHRQGRQGNQMAIEFKALAKNQEEHTTSAALRNVLLNSKQEVVPYDHSRVIVWDRPATLGTDYFNASYIDGYSGPKEYIASQGPNTKCLVSFWHMVWQEVVTCIVMATGLFENAVQQCDKYWVDQTRKHAQYGHIHIWHEQSTHLALLNIRTFRIQKEGCPESRLVTQYEMVGFHDESPDPGLLLDVRRRVNSLIATQPGPVLVHCRCGGGRTAVYIAVDYCLHQLQSEDRVDVYNAVLHLRRFRKSMVRTLSQYKQIYNTVAMFLQCGLTVHPADTFAGAYHVHYAHGGDSKHQRLEKEFQTLQSIVPRLSIGDCASGHRVENRSKSRDIMMLPPECARPYLTTTDCGENGTDFINAVYVDGYHSENSYLVTQWPLKKTVGDLWRLIFDFKITSVVFMNDPQKFSHSYPRFWPKEVGEISCYGPVSVRYLSSERNSSSVTRTFAIRKMLNNLVGCELRHDEIIVKMFQVLNAGQSSGDGTNNPANEAHNCRSHRSSSTRNRERQRGHYKSVGIQSRSLLSLMEDVGDWQKRSSSRQPVCIISKDGCSRVGVYCAVAVCCDQVRVDREVDVFNAVRLVRRNRPQLVPNIEEYRYIYHFMAEFITLSGSKPDIIISEPSSMLQHSDSSHHRAVAAPTTLFNSVHGGVYVVAKGKGSDTLTPHNKGDNSTNGLSDKQFPCISYTGRYHDSASKQNGGLFTSGSTVPCRLEHDSRLYTLSGEHSPYTCSRCGNSCSETNNGDAPHINYVHLQKQNKKFLNGSTPTGNKQTFGQILSHQTLQPLGDIHQSPSDFSIIRHLPQQQSPTISCLKIHPSFSSSQLLSLSSEPVQSALSHTPFLTPEKYQNGRVFNGLSKTVTSSSLSPGSLCKSCSFFSCNSSLSISNNHFGNGSVSNHADIHAPSTINGILLQPTCLNGQLSKSTQQPEKLVVDKLSVYTGLSSSLPTSTLLHPDLSNMKVCRINNGSGHVTLIHASYISLDDSLAGSADGRDHGSIDWAEHDTDAVKLKQCQAKTDFSHQPTRVKGIHNQQPQDVSNEIIKNKCVEENTAIMSKCPASTFSWRQKIIRYKHSKQIKRINPNAS